jgi:excisionase family DNA binding protein
VPSVGRTAYKLKIMSQKKLLTRKEVAKKFRVSKTTLLEWRKKNILPAYKFGRAVRYKEEDIQKAFEQQNKG